MSDEADSPKRSEAEAKWISVQDAARRLGISERAVQLRAASGAISAQRDGRSWRVCLEGVSSREKVSARAEVETKPDESAEAKRSEEDSGLLAHLQAENAWLRQRVEQHEEEIRRRDMLAMADKNELLELRQRLALTAAPDASESSPEAVSVQGEGEQGQRAARPWWRFWKGRG